MQNNASKEQNEIRLGIYRANDGKVYDCLFSPDDGLAQAIGPIPRPGHSGFRGPTFTVSADSEQEAKEKLATKIGPGRW